jgi:hypothetical protein
MADDNPNYTITTGYYPEIAAGKGRKVKYGKGKGRVMQRFHKAKGFSPNSVQREEMLAAKRMAMMGILGGATGGGPGPAAAAGAEILNMKGGYFGKTPQFETFGKFRDSYKYVGGTEEYKLYGDQVWYMHASRGKNNSLSAYLSEEQTTGPQFLNIFHKSKGKMVSKAVALAKEVFQTSWDVAKIESEFKSSGEMVAEEVGFEAGGFRYMSVGAAIKEGHKLKASESSAANNRDMVKIDAEGNIVATYDVTEQTIDVVGMHGITQAPDKALVKAIKELDPNNKGEMEKVRQGVIKMFVAQADQYNQVIRHFKTSLLPKGGNPDTVKWDDLLKKAKGKKKTATVKDLAKYTVGMPNLTSGIKGATLQNNVKVEDYTMFTARDKSKEQTSIEYIAHMLGTMSGDMNKNFKQTHAIVPNKVYAIVPMETIVGGKKNLEFNQKVIYDAQLVEGENATIANHFATHLTIDDNQRTLAAEQNHKFMIAKSNQGAAIKQRGLYYSGTKNNLRNKGLRPATNVSIPAGPELEAALVELLLNAGPDMEEIVADANSKMDKYKLGKPKGKDAFSQTERNTMFWALPYIGVLQSKKDK